MARIIERLSECRLRVHLDYDLKEYLKNRNSPDRRLRKVAKERSQVFTGRCDYCHFDQEISYPTDLDMAFKELQMLHVKYLEALTKGSVK